ncbi:unnamed protein product [Prunus armeniaca]
MKTHALLSGCPNRKPLELDLCSHFLEPSHYLPPPPPPPPDNRRVINSYDLVLLELLAVHIGFKSKVAQRSC